MGGLFYGFFFGNFRLFFTDNGQFRGGVVNLPLPGIQLTPMPSHIVSVPQQSTNCLDKQIFGAGVSRRFS